LSSISRYSEEILRIFDPYVDVRDHKIEEIEGQENSKGHPVGRCNVKLLNGDNVFGMFKAGIRNGRGAISGKKNSKCRKTHY